MTPDLPLTRDLVLIGGGHAHALVLRRWGMAPLPGVRLTLIDPNPAAPYTGMLPGHVAGHYPREALEIDLVRLARHAGARLILGRAEGIDRQARRIRVAGRPGIAYDVTSLDIGVTSAMPDLPGFTAHAQAAKPLGPFAAAWEAFVARAGEETSAHVVVIGGGVAGVELSMAMAHRLRQAGVAAPAVTVIEARETPLAGLGARARARLLTTLAARGVALRTGAAAAGVTAEGVILADGATLEAGFVAGAAGARPQDWLAGTGLALHEGYVCLRETLQSKEDDHVFAVGDCAHMEFDPRPKAGVYAVRQAPVLYDNLCAILSGRRLRAYRPQRDYLKLVSTGGRTAVADKRGFSAEGAWVWRLKDRIDRKFMAQFDDLGPMVAPSLPAVMAEGVREELAGGAMLCAGCGSKLAPGALAAALAGVAAPARDDVIAGAGDDAAVLAHGAGRQVLTTDSLRAFTADPWLFARIAAVHALGDIWAMGAAPQAALATVTLPRMRAAMQAATLAEIMDAAAAVFGAAGADIVGGHSAMGAEMALGFTVTGLAPAEGVIGQDGARPGDALILTKPIGTGVILAAEMAGAAPGRQVMAAFDSMAEPQGAAAAILAGAARAMTDVTGFGLAGHLLGLCDASGAGAVLDLAAVPLLDGAAALAAAGHRSVLWPANAAAARDRVTRPAGARGDLLFDPQTAGGLLAAIPGGAAAEVLARLHDAGVPATQIGEFTDAPPGITAR